MTGAGGCTGTNGCGAGAGARSGSFIAAAKGEPKGMPGGVVSAAWGAGADSEDFTVKRLEIEPCGTIVLGAEAAANGEGVEAGGTAPNGEAGVAAAKGEGEAAGWFVLKGEFPAGKPGCGGGAAGSCGAAGVIENGLADRASCLIENGLAAVFSAAGLMENGEAGAGAESDDESAGVATAKGLIGNVWAGAASVSGFGAT